MKTLTAFVATAMADAKLRADAEQAKLEIDPLPGDGLATVAARVFDAPPAVIQKTAALTARPKKTKKKTAN